MRSVAHRLCLLLAFSLGTLLPCAPAQQPPVTVASAGPSPAIPLFQPTSVAYDLSGNLYFAESRNNVVRRVDRSGQLTTVAGTAIQGFAGDGGLALNAQLDSPRGVAVDSAQNIYIADTRNHRIRRVSSATLQITTIAGTGHPGFAGDGGLATAAQLASPLALALDGSGHLYVADSGNQRVRSIDLSSGLIQTVAGSGRQGFSGDGGPALQASLSAPSGLAADTFGNLFIADAGNQRVREVSATTHLISTLAGDGSFGVRLLRPEGLSLNSSGGLLIADPGANRIYLLDLATGQIRTVAGQGTQAFSGDQGLATLAMLDSPSAVSIGPQGQLAIADTGNQRVRQILAPVPPATIGTIATYVGIGAVLPTQLTLSGAAVQPYGAVALLASLTPAATAQGSVSLLAATAAGQQSLASAVLGSSGTSTLSLPSIAAGTYTLSATYAGDPSHTASQTSAFNLTVTPLPLTASLSLPSLLYGQPLPDLSATLTGILPQDAGQVTATLAGQLPANPPAGTYTLVPSLTGPAAPNYTLPGTPVTLTIGQAPSNIALSSAGQGLGIAVSSSTSGTPTGAVRLLTSAGTQLSAVPLAADGTATLLPTGITPGTYTLRALYSGDQNFLPAQSAALTVNLGASAPPAAGDFSLASAGSASLSVHSGETATFSFALTPTGAGPSGPVLLSSTGVPITYTASLSPNTVSPGSPATSVTLTIATPRASAALRRNPSGQALLALCALVPCLLFRLRPSARARLGRLTLAVLALALPLYLSGCGDRINSAAATAAASKAQTYTVTVAGVASTSTGSTLQHSINVTLIVQ